MADRPGPLENTSAACGNSGGGGQSDRGNINHPVRQADDISVVGGTIAAVVVKRVALVGRSAHAASRPQRRRGLRAAMAAAATTPKSSPTSFSAYVAAANDSSGTDSLQHRA